MVQLKEMETSQVAYVGVLAQVGPKQMEECPKRILLHLVEGYSLGQIRHRVCKAIL